MEIYEIIYPINQNGYFDKNISYQSVSGNINKDDIRGWEGQNKDLPLDLDTCTLSSKPKNEYSYPKNYALRISYQTIQQKTQTRTYLMDSFSKLMDANVLTGKIPFKNIETRLGSDYFLGSGVFGSVCEISFLPPRNKENPFSFAMKVLQQKFKDRYILEPVSEKQEIFKVRKIYKSKEVYDLEAEKDGVKESEASRLVSYLVETDQSPHFSIFLGYSSIIGKNSFDYFLFQELSDGNALDWVDLQAPKIKSNFQLTYTFGLNSRRHMSFAGQILMAILAMILKYKMVHNDLYFRNILFNNLFERSFYYKYIFINQKTGNSFQKYIPIEGTLFKIGDLGLASKEFVIPTETSKVQVEGFIDTNAERYSSKEFNFSPDDVQNLIIDNTQMIRITNVSFLNTYAKDIFTFLWELKSNNNSPPNVVAWAQFALFHMLTEIKRDISKNLSSKTEIQKQKNPYYNTEYSKPEQIVDLVIFLLSPEGLYSSGIDYTMFSPPINYSSIKETFVLEYTL